MKMNKGCKGPNQEALVLCLLVFETPWTCRLIKVTRPWRTWTLAADFWCQQLTKKILLILQCTESLKARIHMWAVGSNYIIQVYLGKKTEYEIFSCYDSIYIFTIFLIIIIDFTHQSEVDLCTTVHFPNLLLVCTSKACVSYQNHWLIAKLKLMYKVKIKILFMVIKIQHQYQLF